MAEGSVWEAANAGIHHGLDNLCLIIDVNGLGQSRATQFGHNTKAIAQRWQAFGWHTLEVDGHSVEALLDAYAAGLNRWLEKQKPEQLRILRRMPEGEWRVHRTIWNVDG